MSSKVLVCCVKLEIFAGCATPGQPVGTALGPRGVNVVKFCSIFNLKTLYLGKDVLTPVKIYIFEDKSFDFILKLPPVIFLLKRISGIGKGCKFRGENVGCITKNQLLYVVKQKIFDLNTRDVVKAFNIVRGSAISLGLKIID